MPGLLGRYCDCILGLVQCLTFLVWSYVDRRIYRMRNIQGIRLRSLHNVEMKGPETGSLRPWKIEWFREYGGSQGRRSPAISYRFHQEGSNPRGLGLQVVLQVAEGVRLVTVKFSTIPEVYRQVPML